jgi:hypothetical protein
MSTESNFPRRWPNASNDSPDLARLTSRLPPLLSVIAGTVDVIGYVGLKLFTAHITGNLVVVAALLVRGGPPNISLVLAVPVFMAAVAGVWLIAKALNRRGPALARPLLLVQFLLLVGVLVLSVIWHPTAKPHGLMAGHHRHDRGLRNGVPVRALAPGRPRRALDGRDDRQLNQHRPIAIGHAD